MCSMVIVRTPLRVSFTGGGTDLPSFYLRENGRVLSTTIDKYIYTFLEENWDGCYDIQCEGCNERVSCVEEISHDIIRNTLKLMHIKTPLKIRVVSQVACSTGLGSSSTFTVGLINACSVLKGKAPDKNKLAEIACHVEIEMLNNSIGKQDQFAAAYGGLNEYEFHQDGTVAVNNLALPSERLESFGQNIALFDSGLRHCAGQILKEQNTNNITGRNLEHLIAIKGMVKELKNTLMGKESLDKIGYILHNNWLAKRNLASTITNDSIDRYYQMAVDCGAIGGKLLGAGGGGFLLLYFDSHKSPEFPAIFNRATGLQRLHFNFEKYGSVVVFHNGYTSKAEQRLFYKEKRNIYDSPPFEFQLQEGQPRDYAYDQ